MIEKILTDVIECLKEIEFRSPKKRSKALIDIKNHGLTLVALLDIMLESERPITQDQLTVARATVDDYIRVVDVVLLESSLPRVEGFDSMSANVHQTKSSA